MHNFPRRTITWEYIVILYRYNDQNLMLVRQSVGLDWGKSDEY